MGPLLAALIALEGRRRFLQAGLLLGIASSCAAAAGLWRAVAREGPVRHLLGGHGAPLGIELRIDGLPVLMLAVTAFVGGAVSIYASAYFGDASDLRLRESPGGRGARFFAPLLLLQWAALNAIYSRTISSTSTLRSRSWGSRRRRW